MTVDSSQSKTGHGVRLFGVSSEGAWPLVLSNVAAEKEDGV